MFEVFVLILFGWLFFEAIRLACKVTWGFAKIAAIVLFIIALPAFIGCLLMAGGILLLIPVVLVVTAIGILKACI